MKKRYVVVGLVLFGVGGYFQIGRAQIDYVIAHISYPVVYLAYQMTNIKNTWLRRRRSIDELVAALMTSQDTIARLSQEIIELRSTSLYLDELHDAQLFRYRYRTDWMIHAQVISKTISPDAHTIILDRGARHGVERDMVVVYQHGIVGRVSDVYPWWCKVTLVTDRLSKIPVICAATKTTGIFEGMNSLTEGSLSYVSHLEPLQEGDLLTTSGDGLIYPRGFAVGHITSIRHDSDKLQYAVTVKPLCDIGSLHQCYILARGAEYDATQPLVETKQAANELSSAQPVL